MHVRKLPETRKRTNQKDQREQCPQITQAQEKYMFPTVRVENFIIHGALGRVVRVLPQYWGKLTLD